METRDITETAQEWQEKAKSLGEQAKNYQARARQAALDAGRATDDYVRDNPWKMVLTATVAGCIIGLLLSRSKD